MNRFSRTKYTCYYSYLATASIFTLPPMLFVTFHEMYNISYTLLGSLVLINFCTQFLIDIIFTAFAKFFNIKKAIRTMPVLVSTGLVVYALFPTFLPGYAYIGFVMGTVLFSIASGLSEVLLSPVVASIPSDNPERDMSMLHSLYAYGVLMVIVVSTVFFLIFGRENWAYLTLFFALLPLVSFVLFCTSPFPNVVISQEKSSKNNKERNKFLVLCMLCIFFGSGAELAMTSWVSGYTEKALGLPKVWGDILGMAGFAVLLGLTRTAYAKYGKNIIKMLTFSMIGATVCYVIAAICDNLIISLSACALTGIFVSMLWPGTLIMMEEKIPGPGVTAYALMAAGGDFGGALSPQILGFVVDKVTASKWAEQLALNSSLSVDSIAMKTGMLSATIFPLLGTFVILYIMKK